MAYRFGQHVAPPQEHHRYSHQSAATATAGLGSYDTGGPPSAYHPHRFQGRERRHSDLSGSQVPAYVQREQLSFGDRGSGGREGRDGRGEQFHQDPDVHGHINHPQQLYFHDDHYRERQNIPHHLDSGLDGGLQETAHAFDYRERLLSEPLGSFSSQQGNQEWENFRGPPSENPFCPPPLMQQQSGRLSNRSSSFDPDTSNRFAGHGMGAWEYGNESGSGGWQSESWRTPRSDTDQHTRSWQHGQIFPASQQNVPRPPQQNFPDSPGRCRRTSGHSESDGTLGRYGHEGSGRESLLGPYQTAPYSGARQYQRSNSLDKGEQYLSAKTEGRRRSAESRRPPSLRTPPHKRGRGREDGVHSRGLVPGTSSSGSTSHRAGFRARGGKHPPKPPLRKSSLKLDRAANSARSSRLTPTITPEVVDKRAGSSVQKKSILAPELFTRRSLHDSARGSGESTSRVRSPSPRTIQERLGPHIPGSGSVQNRLGPPKEVGVHSRLGPEENPEPAAPLESVQSRLGPEGNIARPIPTDNFQFRLGPEENLGNSLSSSTSIHSRLGPEEGLDSGSLLEGPSENFGRPAENFDDPIPLSNVHSRLGPEEIESRGSRSMGGSKIVSDPILSDSIHSRLDFSRPLSPPLLGERGENRPPLDAPLPIASRLGPEDEFHRGVEKRLDAAFGSSHLAPEDNNFSSEAVRSRLGPEISPAPLLEPESRFSPRDVSSPEPPLQGYRGDFSQEQMTPLDFVRMARREGGSHPPGVGSESGPSSQSGREPLYPSRFDKGPPTSYDYQEHVPSGHSDFGARPNEEPLLVYSEYESSNSDYSGQVDVISSSSQQPLLPSDHQRSYHLSGGESAARSSTNVLQYQPPQDSDVYVSSRDGSSISQTPLSDSRRKSEDLIKTTDIRQSEELNEDLNSKSAWDSTGVKLPGVCLSNLTPVPPNHPQPTKGRSKLCPDGSKKKWLPPDVSSAKQKTRSSKPSQSSGSQSKDTTNTAPDSVRKKSAKESRLPATSSGTVGQSIPTLIKKQAVPSAPAKKGPQKSSSSKTLPKPKPLPVKKADKSVKESVKSPYSVPSAPDCGYKDTHSECGSKDELDIAKDKLAESTALSDKPSDQPSVQGLKSAASVEQMTQPVPSVTPQSTPDAVQLKVGVASVVSCGREMEEGEVTDSECEDLVIDLDTSSSSVATPSQITTAENVERGALKSRGRPEADPKASISNIPVEAKVVGNKPKETKAVDEVPNSDQKTKDCQATKLDREMPANRDQKTKDSARDHHQDTKPVKNIKLKETKSRKTKQKAHRAPSLSGARARSGLERKAATILHSNLAMALSSTLIGGWGTPSILTTVRTASAKLSEYLKRVFKKSQSVKGISEDLLLSYAQMKLPECAIGKASILKLAYLMAVDSPTFFHCDLLALQEHCSGDVKKWNQVGKKYYDGVVHFMTISQMKIFFSKSLYKDFGGLVSEYVLANIPRGHKTLGRATVEKAAVGPTFLEVAREKYGPSLTRVLNEIDNRVRSAAGRSETYGGCFVDEMGEKSGVVGSPSEQPALTSSNGVRDESGDNCTVEDMVMASDEEEEGGDDISPADESVVQTESSSVQPTPRSESTDSAPHSSLQLAQHSISTGEGAPATESCGSKDDGPLSSSTTDQLQDTVQQSATIIEEGNSSDLPSPLSAKSDRTLKVDKPSVCDSTSLQITATELSPSTPTEKSAKPAKPVQPTGSESPSVAESDKPHGHCDNIETESQTEKTVVPSSPSEVAPDESVTDVSVAEKGTVAKSETETGNKFKTEGVPEEADDTEADDTVSISSGEIISPPNSPSCDKKNDEDKTVSNEDNNSLRGSFDWRGRGYFPPRHHRVIPLAFFPWGPLAQPPPLRGRWRENPRGQPASGPRDNFRRGSRSKSRSPSPRGARREQFSRRSRKRYSSPEGRGISSRHRDRHAHSSLSPDSNRRTSWFGKVYDCWKRRTSTTADMDTRPLQRGRGRGRGRKRRGRSCDRTGTGESSDEDLEVLELRKEALMSMLSEERSPLKSSEQEGEDVGKEGVAGVTGQDGENEEKNCAVSEEKKAPGEEKVEATEGREGVIKITDSEKVNEEDETSKNGMEQSKRETNQGGTETRQHGVVEVSEVETSKPESKPSPKEKSSSTVEVTTATEGEREDEVVPVEVSGSKTCDDNSDFSSPTATSSTSHMETISPKLAQSDSPQPPTKLKTLPSVDPSVPSSAKPSDRPPQNFTAATAPESTTTTASSSNAPSVGVALGTKVRETALQLQARARVSAVRSGSGSRPQSGSGSRTGSPASSRGSPVPLIASGMESGATGVEPGGQSRRGTEATHPLAKPSTSVKVLPGSKGTWEIPAFHIHLAESEEDDEQRSETETESSGGGVNPSHRPPTMDEIDSVLGFFRRDAEAKAKSKERTIRSPDPAPAPPPTTKGEPLQSSEIMSSSSRSVDLAKPEAVEMLPLNLQREYLELKTRLALHAKRQREEQMASGKGKGKRPLTVSSSKKGKSARLEPVKPVLSSTATFKSTSTGSDQDSPKQVQLAREVSAKQQTSGKEEEKGEEKVDEGRLKDEQPAKEAKQNKRESEAGDLAAMEKKEKTQEEIEKQRANPKTDKTEKEEEKERRKKKRKEAWLKKKKRREMKVAELEGKIRSCRSQNEWWTTSLTSLTNSLADCETESEEHELKIELLLKQLKTAQSCREQCRQRRTQLQEKVRVSQENINRHSSIIQDTQRLLITERDLLITMEGSHNDGVDMETVSMEEDSDGSKGEGEMDVVTSSDEAMEPLVFEAISDAEVAPGPQSIPSVKSGSHVLVPVSGMSSSVLPPCDSGQRGKKRRRSRSERTRKSSLSLSHSSGDLVSDSDTDESASFSRKALKIRKAVSIEPPPTSPPSLTTHTPSHPHSLTTSPSSLLSLTARCLASNQDSIPAKPAKPVTASSDSVINGHVPSEVSVTESQDCGSQTLSATLPVPPIDVEFITDTDTGSECGPAPVPIQDPVPPSTQYGNENTPPVPKDDNAAAVSLSGTQFSGSVEMTPPVSHHGAEEEEMPSMSVSLLDSQSTFAVSGDNITEPVASTPLGPLAGDCSILFEGTTPLHLCMPSEPSPVKNIHNPFISMLKIAKIESLSESSDAFSPAEKHFEADHVTPPTCHVMSHDMEEASHDHASAGMLPLPTPETPPVGTAVNFPQQPTKIHEVLEEDPSNFSPDETQHFTTFESGITRKFAGQSKENVTFDTSFVYVAVIDPPPELVNADGSYQRMRRYAKRGFNYGKKGGSEGVNNGRKSGKKSKGGGKRGEMVLKKKTGQSGRVAKATPTPIRRREYYSKQMGRSPASVFWQPSGPSINCAGTEEPSLCGPPVPLLKAVPRSVPSIPFEICSSGLDVCVVQWLVNERFVSVSKRRVERVPRSMETADPDSECMGISQFDKRAGSDERPGTRELESGSMEVSQNETATHQHSIGSQSGIMEAPSSSLGSEPTVVASLNPHPSLVASSSTQQIDSHPSSSSQLARDDSSRPTQPGPSTITTASTTHPQPPPPPPLSRQNLKVKAAPQTEKPAEKSRVAGPLTDKKAEDAGGSEPSRPISVDGLLDKIREVKDNLEKQGRGGKLAAAAAAKNPAFPDDPTANSSREAKPVSPQPLSTMHSKQATQSVGLEQDRARPQMDYIRKQLLVKGAQTAATSATEMEGEAKSSGDTERSSSGVGTDMESVVKALGLKTTWKELQKSLKSSTDPLFEQSLPVICFHDATTANNPLVVKETARGGRSEVISATMLESVHKQTTQGSTDDAKQHSLRRYKPYTSPLLSLSSYRLNPNYRTHERLPLSSLSHSNKIDPAKIWCRYEVFGKCSDAQCTRQHMRDVILSKSELVDDIIAYSPSLSADSTEISGPANKTDTRVTKVLKSEKHHSYGESLMATYSRKMSEEQLLKLATYRVNQMRGEGEVGVVKAEETRLRHKESVGRAKETPSDEATRPPPLYLTVERSDFAYSDTQPPSSEATAPPSIGVQVSKVDRYFTASSSPSSPPETSSGPAHFLSLSRASREPSRACAHLESGLSLHAGSDELWVEYLGMKSVQLTGSDCRGDREELLSKALIMCPTYAVILKCVELAVSVEDKASWIKRGYLAITCAQPRSPLSLSLCCLELLLSHTYLCCTSGRLDIAMATLQQSLEIENETTSTKKDSPFSDIITHLSIPHLKLSYLTLTYLMYVQRFPHEMIMDSSSLPVRLKTETELLLVPWSMRSNLTSEKLQKIEQLLAVAITRCQCQDPSDSMETTFALYHNLVLFQLVHRSQEIAQQTLSGLLNCSPHSSHLWILAAQFKDWTSNSEMAIKVLEKAATEKGLDSNATELYCYAAKLVLRGRGCQGDVSSAMLPWLRDCVCRYYSVAESEREQLSSRDIALMYRKLLGQMVPYDYTPPGEMVRLEEAKKNLPHLWVAYCLLVRVSHATLRGNYHHSTPEEAFESAVHSVNQPSHLRIVWLQYLTYLRDNSLARKNSLTAFESFSDCVYRCLVVMDTKQALPTALPGQPLHYHDYSFHEKVCDIFFGSLSPWAPCVMNTLTRLLQKILDNAHLITRLSLHCLNHNRSSLDLAQSTLASFLSIHPKCLHLWQIAVQVELALNKTREARWLYREAVKHFPLSSDLWKEFLLFELNQLSQQAVNPSPSPSLACNIVNQTTHLGVALTPSSLPSPNSR